MVTIIVTSTNDTIVRTLFCHKLWKFSEKNYYVTIPIMLAASTSLIGGIIFTIKAVPLEKFTAFSAITCWLYLGFVSGAVADILLASSLVTLLWKHRTGFPRTDSLVRVLIIYTINSGVLTSVCEVMCIVTFSIFPGTFWYYALYMVLPKLHVNSLLASYNARHDMREVAFAPEDLISVPLANTAYSPTLESDKFRSNKKLPGIEVRMVTETKSGTQYTSNATVFC
ncbi:hypothetical protein OBBRIDRAFT_628710 [Obba rivulosa]|uniref:DUF6534 domain-containing protein n=1 Tax=Obba rivulosa TaxID=1052685 RepID=A0A8E2B0M5_9APHY|nr:hypothetical protein OBBRIDRAFT_628710 [Obba rivulosa]